MRIVRTSALLAAATLGVIAGPATAGASGATEAYPPLGLDELSGMAASALHPDVLWAVEDGSVDDDDRSRTRAYDADGELVATITLDPSWNNRDTEAVAIGPGVDGPASATLWVADIGDNDAVRESVVVHTFPEPAVLADAEVTPVSYRLRFPDGPRDAEAFLVDPVDGRGYVVTKSIAGSGSLYALPLVLVPGETHDLTLLDGVPSWVTDASFTPDGARLVLLSAVPVVRREAVLYDVTRAGGGAPMTITETERIGLPALQQAEALTITPDGTRILVSGELGDPVWAVPMPPASEAASASAGPPGAGGTPATTGDASVVPTDASVLPADGCDLRDPQSCLGEPLGWVAVGALLLVGLVVGARFVLRRAPG